MSSSSILPPPATSSPAWSDLPSDLLRRVISHLPYPGERAQLTAVCRAWHAAVKDHVRHPPWVVLADGSFCIPTTTTTTTTTSATAADDDNDDDSDDDDDDNVFFDGLPGLLSPPDDDDGNATAAMTTGSFVAVGSTDDWLLLDTTCDDEQQRKYLMGEICSNCSCSILHGDDVVVKRKPRYLLRNAFSGATVPLPELGTVIDGVSRMFEIYKVLIRSPSNPGDDIIVVVTNNWDYNIIMCRPGKGPGTSLVLSYYDIFDVAFAGDWLYGITPSENLVGFCIVEDDEGRPDVARTRRFIVNPLPEGEEDGWRWIDDENNDEGGHGGIINDDNNNNDQDGHGGGAEDNQDIIEGDDQEEEADKVDDDQAQNKQEEEEDKGGHGGGTHGDEGDQEEEVGKVDGQAQIKQEDEENKDGSHGGGTADDEDIKRGDQDEEEVDNVDDQAQNKQEEDENNKTEGHEGEDEADDEAQNTEEEDSSSGDGMIPNGVDDAVIDEESLNEPKDYIVTFRKLVKSRAGELLMVRRQLQVPAACDRPPNTRKVEIFKADINGGKWLPVTGASCLAEDEALFLSKSFSKSVRAHGEIRGRFIYFDDTLEAFDTTSSTSIPSSLEDEHVYRLLRCKWRTWVFPQEFVV